MGRGKRLERLLLIACIFATLLLVRAQDQSDFISIDCGSSAAYSDDTTGINYVPDDEFIDSGNNSAIAAQYKINGLQKQFENVRSFPYGKRNCYTLRPNQVEGTQYFMRAQFMYGNYDLKNRAPEFDLYIGVNLWTTISFQNTDEAVTAEMIHVPSTSITNVCLVNKNLGTPFISVLELRLVDKEAYSSQTGTLNLAYRLNLGTNSKDEVRFADDLHDRIWKPIDWSDTMSYLSTNLSVGNGNSYQPPVKVLSTAITPKNASSWLQFYWSSADIETQHYIYLHFAELTKLPANESRKFDIYLNDTLFYLGMTPNYLSVTTVYTPKSYTGTWYNFSFRMTDNSTLPPILNALEVYTLNLVPQMETNTTDIEVINKIKTTYDVKKLWQGDPCAPRNFSWDGLTCSFPGFLGPRITGLNLSSSNLVGQISQNISGLQLLESLDLSDNNLTGNIPDFLSAMAFLKVLNLKGNNLTGTVPAELLKKSQSGTLIVSVDGSLCISNSCNDTKISTGNKKKTNLVIPIVASIAGALVLIVAVSLIVIFCVCKRKEAKDGHDTEVASETYNSEAPVASKTKDRGLESGNQQFTYSQILTMTNNFERAIGKGGFGTVYHGYLDGAQVAVKMLSPSSSQGYKEFQAEAKLLMRVHHRNLTSLVGYCDEDGKLGLIYEYMANGNLETNLSSTSPEYLTWEDRLYIAVDSAQGLEYLHNGCKPPIVHRDVKSPNILLDDKFHAKLADFGLSRVFPVDGGAADYVPTVVAGTPGYLDPEYYSSQWLNEKSDVYSFGVVLLEIITSQPVIAETPDKTHISKRVSHVLSTTGNVKSIVDPKLRGDYDINSVWKAIEIAMACVSHSSNKRPTMTQVVNELSQCLKMEKARKKDEYATEATMDSIEMASVDMNTRFTPLAR